MLHLLEYLLVFLIGAIYGTGACLIYAISKLPINLLIKVVLFAVLTTSIEYLTGVFFLKKFHVRLWDYTNVKFNIKGHIAPLFTGIWTVMSIGFYYLLYPNLHNQVTFLYNHLEFSLFLGFFYGVIFIDLIHSINLVSKLKIIMDSIGDSEAFVHYEKLKLDVQDKIDHLKNKLKSRPTFMLPFNGEYNLKQRVAFHLAKLKEEVESRHK
jgi:uncharacterized membrane protein